MPIAFIRGSIEAAETLDRIKAARENLSGSSLTVIEGGEHLSTVPRPEFLKTVMSFFRANAAKSGTEK